jgi:hypothetical protein
LSIYDIAFAVVDALERLGIEYLLVGGIAVMYHGYSRTTEDVDFVIALESQQRLSELVSLLGPGYSLSPQATFEVYTSKTYRTIEVLGTPIKIDVFFVTDDFDREQFARKKKLPLFNRKVFLPTAEDVIVIKLRWQRRKDLVDVMYVMGLNDEDLDWNYLEKWCAEHGTRDMLLKLRSELPPRRE